MDKKKWNIGFYREFAVDFEDDGWRQIDDNILDGLDEPNIRILYSLDALKKAPNLLPDQNLFFAFEGTADDFIEQMLRNSSNCGFSGTFVTYDVERRRFCHQHLDNGELDTGWIWLENEWFPEDFDEISDGEEFLDYVYNYQDMTDELKQITESNSNELFEGIQNKNHFFEKYGINENNHYFSEKISDALPDSFNIENESYNINSQTKERFQYLLENGIEKFEDWIEDKGI